MQEIVVSEVDIFPVRPKNGLVAFASIVVNGQLFLGNIAVYTRFGGGGFRLVFPVKILPNGKEIHCCQPLTKEAGDLLREAVSKKFQQLTEKMRVKKM